VVIRLRSRWLVLIVLGAIATASLVREHFSAGSFVLAGVLIALILLAFRMRIEADDSGVTIVNFFLPVFIPWREVDGFRMAWSVQTRCLEVRRRSSRRVRGWALNNMGVGGLLGSSEGQIQAAIDELRRWQAQANGETVETVDARAVDEALRAAENGDYAPFRNLLGDDFRVFPDELWERASELAARGRIDMEALRASGPKIPRSVTRYIAEKHPDIPDE